MFNTTRFRNVLKINLLVLLFFVAGASSSFAQIDFIKGDWDGALRKAKKEGKPVIVDFYATWCGPCKMMDRSTFQDAKLSKFVNENFIPLKIDIDKHEDLARRFQIRSVPTFAVVDAKGKIEHRFVGYKDAGRFQAEIMAYADAGGKAKDGDNPHRLTERKFEEYQQAYFDAKSKQMADFATDIFEDELALGIAKMREIGHEGTTYAYEQYMIESGDKFNDNDRLLLRLEYLLAAKKFREAEQLIDTERPEMTNPQEVYYASHNLNYRDEDVPSMPMRWLNKAVRQNDPTYVVHALDTKAYLRMQEGKYADAIEACETALKMLEDGADGDSEATLKLLALARSQA